MELYNPIYDGEQLSVFSRIVTVADAFDAMTSVRPYRQGMAVDDALERLHQGLGTQFEVEFSGMLELTYVPLPDLVAIEELVRQTLGEVKADLI